MLVNSKKILIDAMNGKYAVPHFNINNLEWCKYILEVSKEMNIPVILGVSEGTIKYIGGVNAVASMVKGLAEDIGVDTVLHLDHGQSIDICKKCIDAGFSSVMIDASTYPLDQNINIVKEVVEYAHSHNVTVEAEIGQIGGAEDGIETSNYNAKLVDVIELVNSTNVDSVAPALGSVHGLYKGEPNLDFITMEEIHNALRIPLVLHGGTGIGDVDIRKAISNGVCKLNINTELQIVWSDAVRKFLENDKTTYDPRKIIGAGEVAMKNAIREKIKLLSNI